MTAIKKIGKEIRAAQTSVGTLLMDSNNYPTGDSFEFDTRTDWEADSQVVQGKRVVPYGVNNQLPIDIRNLMDDNNLAPGILEREKGLLYGSGPQLFETEFTDGQFVRKWVDDEEIWSWLNSWDFGRFVDMALTEFKYLKGVFVKYYRNKGARIGAESKITELKVVPGTDARLGWPETGGKQLENVTKIFTGDFENNCQQDGVITYNVFNKRAPFKFGVSIGYHNSYSFGRSFYSLPSMYQTRNWISRANDAVDTIKYFQDNAINAAYQIISPAGYWDQKLEKLREDHPGKSEKEIDSLMEGLKDETFKNISKVLSGKSNAGKFLETVSWYDDNNNKQEWEIKAIEQNLKDFISAMVQVSEKADSAITSGMGLHPGLSNIIVNGKFNSGSELLYALKLYMASDTSIPESVIFESVNNAIAANWPNSKKRLGFYHPAVNKESEVSPDKRVKETL